MNTSSEGASQSTSVALVYLVSVNDVSLLPSIQERFAPLRPELLLELPHLAVLVVHSPHTYIDVDVSTHQLIDDDLDRIRREVPEIGQRFPHIDGQEIGNRWPVLFATTSGEAVGPDQVTLEVSFDNLVVRQCNDDLRPSMIRIVANALARYRSLSRGLAVCRGYLSAAAVARSVLREGSSECAVFQVEKNWFVLARVLTENRPELYWGCEFTLRRELDASWRIHDLEDAAASAFDAVQLLRAEEMAIVAQESAMRLAKSAVRTNVSLLVLTLLGGLSALAALIDFAASGGPLALVLSRGVIGVALIGLFLVLLYATLSSTKNSREQSGLLEAESGD